MREVNDSVVLNGLYHYEHKNGRLLYAVVNAETEDNALIIANFIIKELSEKILGHDYVN